MVAHHRNLFVINNQLYYLLIIVVGIKLVSLYTLNQQERKDDSRGVTQIFSFSN